MRWEYKLVYAKISGDIIELLNELGLEGWELVQVHWDGSSGLHAWLKRPCQ